MRPADIDELLSCKPRWGHSATARIRIWRSERLAVLTELDDNEGPSVTNAAEDFWTAFERRFEVDLLNGPWTVLEHYPASRGVDTKTEVDLVIFTSRDKDGLLAHPTWVSGRQSGHHEELADVL
jgi:hypothetical protein